ncbi:MAG TPA: potassium channel family protein [Gemmatimonadota bacterium]|nr:potassium channel family protein [Gemmatimonadota bacterium]
MTEHHNDPRRATELPEELERERYELLQRIEAGLETPMVGLAFVWLALLVVELVRGTNRAFEVIGGAIWIVFILDFALTFFLAPRKGQYLRRNWLVALSLVVPALRVFRVIRVVRVLRLARVGRGLRLFRVLTSLNRGMRALGASLRRRGFGYVLALSVLVLLAGAAGMYAFENQVPGGLDSYGEALWWTAMVMTTLGSQYWPVTLEGRLLCVLLALYALGAFGYVAATLATYFIGRDAESNDAELAGARELAALRREVAAVREEIRALRPGGPA